MDTRFKDVATRQMNGENKFIDCIMETAGCTMAEAEKVLRIYRKMKVLKIDPIMGQFNIKHGAFMEVDVIQNAINYNG